MSAAYMHCVNGLLTSIVWTLTGRLYDVYITDIVYLLDVLVVINSLYVLLQLLGLFIIARELGWVFWRLGGGVQVGGWGGGIFNWKFFFAKKCSWGLKTQKKKKKKNVPGVLKRMQTKIYFSGGGGFWGVWGAPRPHPGVARGRKAIHFFLWPWYVTG